VQRTKERAREFAQKMFVGNLKWPNLRKNWKNC